MTRSTSWRGAGVRSWRRSNTPHCLQNVSWLPSCCHLSARPFVVKHLPPLMYHVSASFCTSHPLFSLKGHYDIQCSSGGFVGQERMLVMPLWSRLSCGDGGGWGAFNDNVLNMKTCTVHSQKQLSTLSDLITCKCQPNSNTWGHCTDHLMLNVSVTLTWYVWIRQLGSWFTAERMTRL